MFSILLLLHLKFSLQLIFFWLKSPSFLIHTNLVRPPINFMFPNLIYVLCSYSNLQQHLIQWTTHSILHKTFSSLSHGFSSISVYCFPFLFFLFLCPSLSPSYLFKKFFCVSFFTKLWLVQVSQSSTRGLLNLYTISKWPWPYPFHDFFSSKSNITHTNTYTLFLWSVT